MPRQGGKAAKPGPGGRKKPFSGKQKKEQLQQKRDRRRQHDDSQSPGSMLSAEHGVASVHTSLGRSGQENALSTMFVKELSSVVEERKRAASLPICLTGLGTPPTALPSPDTSLPFPLPPAVARAVANTSNTDAQGRSFMQEYDDQDAQSAFAAWLRATFAAFQSWAMNKFEVNLNVWKQLWHTLQHSTHIVFVVDARNPLFHVHFHLYDVCARVLGKPLVLLLNKCELVPPDTLQRWVRYLQHALPQCAAIVPFTTAAAQITHDAKERLASRRRALREAQKAHGPEHKQPRLASAEALMHALQLPEAWSSVQRNIQEASGAQRSNTSTVADRLTTKVAPSELTSMALPGGGLLHSADCDSSDDDDWGQGQKGRGRKGRKGGKGGKRGGGKKAPPAPPQHEDSASTDSDANTVGTERDPPLPPYEGPPAVIGMIGYPNVGKSSVINLLLGGKRVSVSRTPGHTKHCQSLQLCGGAEKGVTILDCPGLVFPCTLQPGAQAAARDILGAMCDVGTQGGAAAQSSGGDSDPSPAHALEGGNTVVPIPEPLLSSGSLKLQGPALQLAMQECAGVVPLAQVREPYTAMRFLCEALPLPRRRGTKRDQDPVGGAGMGGGSTHVGGVLVHSDEDDAAGSTAQALSAWSPYSLCEAYAEKKGIRIARTGAPDTHAAGRALLYDTVDGVIPLYWEPPEQGTLDG